MKINKLFSHKNKLIELIIFKYFLKKSQSIDKYNYSSIVIRIKKILHIVYKYHTLKKKILFLGTPIENHFYIEKFLKPTQHIALPENIWVNGLITNKKSCFKSLVKSQTYSKNTMSNLLLKLNEPIDLIVIINYIENKAVAEELLNSQIPIIYLYNSKLIANSSIDLNYTVGIKLKPKKTIFNFFFAMIKSIIKKSPQKKFRFQGSTKI
jgi:ribosomal protein S2